MAVPLKLLNGLIRRLGLADVLEAAGLIPRAPSTALTIGVPGGTTNVLGTLQNNGGPIVGGNGSDTLWAGVPANTTVTIPADHVLPFKGVFTVDGVLTGPGILRDDNPAPSVITGEQVLEALEEEVGAPPRALIADPIPRWGTPAQTRAAIGAPSTAQMNAAIATALASFKELPLSTTVLNGDANVAPGFVYRYTGSVGATYTLPNNPTNGARVAFLEDGDGATGDVRVQNDGQPLGMGISLGSFNQVWLRGLFMFTVFRFSQAQNRWNVETGAIEALLATVRGLSGNQAIIYSGPSGRLGALEATPFQMLRSRSDQDIDFFSIPQHGWVRRYSIGEINADPAPDDTWLGRAGDGELIANAVPSDAIVARGQGSQPNNNRLGYIAFPANSMLARLSGVGLDAVPLPANSLIHSTDSGLGVDTAVTNRLFGFINNGSLGFIESEEWAPEIASLIMLNATGVAVPVGNAVRTSAAGSPPSFLLASANSEAEAKFAGIVNNRFQAPIPDGVTGQVQAYGLAQVHPDRQDDGPWNIGDEIYLSTTPGHMTKVPPVASGTWVARVGTVVNIFGGLTRVIAVRVDIPIENP